MQLRLKTNQIETECAAYRCKSGPNGQYLGIGYLCTKHAKKAAPARAAGTLELTGAAPLFGSAETTIAEMAAPPETAVATVPETIDEAMMKAQAAELQETLELVASYEVTTDTDVVFAKGEKDDAQKQWKHWEGKRTKITKPLNEGLREANAMFKPVQGALKQIEKAWADKLVQRRLKQIEEQAAHLEAARLTETPSEIHTEMVAAATVNTEVEGASFIDNWKFEIADASQVPREWLAPDERKIGAVVKALKGKTAIAGVRVWNAPYMRNTK